jgi:hypothetical protein
MKPWIVLLLAIACLVGCREDAAIGEPAEVEMAPLDAVESFYTWYTQYPPGDARRAELDLATSEALAPELRAGIQELGRAVRADPVVCAQDMPQGFFFRQQSLEAGQATVLVQTLWNPGTEYEMTMDIIVSLSENGDVWQIKEIDCPGPEH